MKMPLKIPFKEDFSIENRRNEAKKVLEKYPERLPVIITKDVKSQLPSINQVKFLIPYNLTIAQLIYIIRNRISIKAEETINIFVEDIEGNIKLPPTGSSLNHIYKENVDNHQKHKNYDGFLYIIYSGENVFG